MHLGGLLAATIALAPLAAGAAELTRLASSFEEKDPFGMFLDISFERLQQSSKIIRENYQAGDVADVSELRFVHGDSRLNIDVRVGLYQDLELKYRLPLVFAQNRVWAYSQGANPTNETNSTITNNCIRSNGTLTNPNCLTDRTGAEAIFPVPNASYRGGLGNMTFGLAYAFFNQEKDETKPTWIVGVDYEAPTADLLDPTLPTTPDDRGRIGDRIHRYKVYTSLSRRLGVADPYFQVYYVGPFRGPGWYSNCDNPQNNAMGYPQNCGLPGWSRADTGIVPPHQGGFLMGTELVPFEKKEKGQKVAFDIRGLAHYTSEGRSYNELSDLFGKYLLTGDHLEVGGQLGLVAHAAEFVRLNVSASLSLVTDHTLTNEAIGKDTDGNGRVDVTQNPAELNPNFDHRADMVSRRFRTEEAKIFRLNATMVFSF